MAWLVALSCIGYIQAQSKPNIVVILADDIGYRDVGFTGAKDMKTTNIDKLARKGVIFNNGYVTHPYCGPSRAGLLTGRHQARFGMENNVSNSPEDKQMGLIPPNVGRLFFDMKSDPYEQNNIVDLHPQQQTELVKLWNEWNSKNINNILLQSWEYEKSS